MSKISVGEPAPDFTLMDADGKETHAAEVLQALDEG